MPDARAFVDRATAVGCQVSLAGPADVDAVVGAVVAEMEATATQACTLSARAALMLPELADALSEGGADVRIAEELAAGLSTRELAERLAGRVGVVAAEAGVVETGSVLPSDDTLPARLTGMLSESVVVLLPSSRLLRSLDDLADLLSQLAAQGRHFLSLVTGPSRTSDIERVLTIGVQGPRRLHVVILQEEARVGNE